MVEEYSHFKDKDAIGHVVEAQARGVISAAEIHGIETPGHISAFADTMRETALILLLFSPLFFQDSSLWFYFLFGWISWKIGRAAWLGWARLERLHRVLEQEKWEIEHNRPQERDELRELYRAKGFEGKLLEDVLQVLMADGDRLLKVMVEEELGLSLENVEHPLKQGLGAGLGASLAAVLCLLALYFFSLPGLLIAAFLIVACAAALLASYAQNRIIPAIVWNVALAFLAYGITTYSYQLAQ